jgi:hemoglobin/transferrin/lactoferrin receptor protein
MNRTSASITIVLLSTLLCLQPLPAEAGNKEDDSKTTESLQGSSVSDKESGIIGDKSIDAKEPREVFDLMKTIIVTGKRFESPLHKNPQAVIVVNRENICMNGTSTVGNLLRGKPGLSVQSDGAWGMNPTIRALNVEQIVIMIDGVRLNSAQPRGAIASFVDPNRFERIEVVKGPTSLLYGSGAMGGVVNFISKRHSYTENPAVSGHLSLNSSSVNEGYLGSWSCVVTNPRHILEFSLSGTRIEDYDAPAGRIDRTGFKQWGVNGRYRVNLGKAHDLSLSFQNEKVEEVWYPGSAIAHPSPVVGISTIHSPKQERTLFRADYAAPFGNSRLEVYLNHQEVEREIFAFSENLQKDFVRNIVPFTTIGGGTKLDIFPIENHRVSVGLDLWRMEGAPERWMDKPPPSDSAVRNDPFKDGEVLSAGVYIQDNVVLDSWTFKYGIRFDQVTGDASQVGTGLSAKTEGLEHTDKTISWSAGAVYHHSESYNPYFNLAQGYRAADMREKFERAVRGDGFVRIGDPQLNPENNITAEAGMRGRISGLCYSLCAYSSWIEDFIAGRETGVTDPGTGLPIKQTENLAKVEIRGVEIELDYDLGNYIHTYFLGSYQRGDNKYDDEPLFQVPPGEVTLGLGYYPRLRWNGDIHWRLVDAQNRVAEKFSNGTEDRTAGFGTVDIRIGYRFTERYEAHLTAANLSDKEYHEHLTEGVSGNEIKAPGFGVSFGVSAAF